MPDQVPLETVQPRAQGGMIPTIREEMDLASSDQSGQDDNPADKKASTDPEGAKNTGDTDLDKGQKAAADKEADPNAKPKDEDDLSGERFDKNPIFRELNQRFQKGLRKVEERAIRAEAQVDALLKAKGGKEDGEDGKDWNVLDLDDDKIREQLDADPKGFLANFARQVAAEVEGRVKEGSHAESFKDRQMKSLESYADKNPDFVEMWERGELQKYMKENPGHTAISAHMVLTEPKRQEEAIKKAVKEAREEERRNVSSRGRARTVTPAKGGAPRESVDDAQLKDTNKAGGRTRVIANMLKTFRSSR